MLIQKTKVGPWEINTSSHSLQMGEWEVKWLHDFLEPWSKHFPKSNNMAEWHFSVPSTLIRFDYAHDPYNSRGTPINIYEIEERPAGLGLASQIHPEFLPRLMPIIREQEDALNRPWSIYVSNVRDGSSDDDVFAENSGVKVFRGHVPPKVVFDNAWYVRASRHENAVAKRFTRRSVSTIAHEGNKSYGVPLELWDEITKDFEPNFEKSFVLKPASGSRFEEVLLWHPEKRRESGFATKTKVTEAIRQGKVSFKQAYAPPEEPDFLDEKFRLIRRAYFVWSPKERDYVSLGGVWVAAPSARVHGTRDAISGVLLTA